MGRTLVLYATRHGQAQKVAAHVGDVLREHGARVDVLNVARLPRDFGFEHVAAIVLVASVHMGAHQREMVSFVARHRELLSRMATGFLSVSLSQAGVEDVTQPDDRRLAASREVTVALDRFFRSTGFRPQHVKPVAGALPYTRYNALVRFVMRRIARQGNLSTDTSRDHEYTRWDAVTQFAHVFAAGLYRQSEPALQSLAS
jgi:menaquinone-dependent protoporphyrinogen oxidase